VSRRHRFATVALLGVLLWTPAQAAVCLGWCDFAPAGRQASAHAGHETQNTAVTTAPCHGAGASAGTTLSAVTQAACDDAPGTFANGVLPASTRTDAVVAPAAFVFVGARAVRPFTRAASDAGPPGSVPSRAPLVLRI
jgi:hypothetical protein